MFISFYNKTSYSGLEIHISNSYANPLLQVLHFTPLIRNLALQHTASACINDACLLCELGFLFDMLEKAEGSICQATNLLKTFSGYPQGKNMYLVKESLLMMCSRDIITIGGGFAGDPTHDNASEAESILYRKNSTRLQKHSSTFCNFRTCELLVKSYEAC